MPKLEGDRPVEFRKHLDKGIWAVADKFLPVLYGLGYVLLVIRVLPEEEFGDFVLVQEVFLIISALATAFALQPLLKFASEDVGSGYETVGAALWLNMVFTVVASALLLLGSGPLSWILNAPGLSHLLLFVPAMLAASFMRNVTLILLQSQFRIKQVFWVDAMHFIGALLLIWIYSRLNMFNSALDLIVINLVSLSASSLIGILFTRRMLFFSFSPRRKEVQRIWDFGKFSVGGVLSYLVYSKADTFILSAITGPIAVAVYNAAKIFVRVYEMLAQVVQMLVLPASSLLSSRKDVASMKILTEKAILFFTVAALPVLILFLLGSPLFVRLLYSGRYSEAIPILQVFSLLSLAVPAMVVGSNILMGLGQVRKSFILGIHMLWISLVAYLLCIPWLGPIGAAIGGVVATYIVAWMTLYTLNVFVPIRAREILQRTSDIKGFLLSRLGKE